MRDPDKLGQVGKAWRVTRYLDQFMVDFWLINLPNFHPMLEWFGLCAWVEEEYNTTTVYMYHVNPESHLFTEVDPDNFKEQKIEFLPEHILKHSLPRSTAATHPVLLAALVQAVVEGQLEPNEESQQDMGNFLTNTARWLSP